MKTKLLQRTLISIFLLTALLPAISCSGGDQQMLNTGYAMGRAREELASYDSVAYSEPVPQAISMSYMSSSSMAITTGSFEMIEEAAGAIDSAGVIQERKLVKWASVRIRVEVLDAADASISGLMETYDAYAASTNIEENSRHYSLRVPAPQYDTFLAEMNGLGRLLNRYESTEDVTLRYYDLEGRLATKRELLRTFQSYLGRANNIDEILAVEARISELQYDIESTGIQLRNLANRVDYATIDLSLLGPVTVSPTQRLTIGERIKQLFSGFGSFFSTVAVIIVGAVVYGIPVLLLLVLIFWLLFGRIGLLKRLWRIVKK